MILSEVDETYLDEEIDKISNKTVMKVWIFEKIVFNDYFFFLQKGENSKKSNALYKRG